MNYREEEIRNLYKVISGSRNLQDRLDKGSCSSIQDLGDGWLSKADLPGIELIEKEFKVLVELQDLLPESVPEIDLDWGIQCGYFMMKKVDNGATLEEYVDLACNGYMSTELFGELLEEVIQTLNRFWDTGYVHGDLHLGNIVIGIKGGKWHPVLIDFGFSFNEAEPPESWELQSTITCIEEDRKHFFDSLYQAVEGYQDLTQIVSQID